MNLKPEEHKILELAVEDFYGLWEVIGVLRSFFPGSDPVEIQQIAERIVKELLLRRLVTVVLRRAGSAQEVVIRDDEIEDVLLSERVWREPTADSHQILVAATEEGERLYYSKDARLRTDG